MTGLRRRYLGSAIGVACGLAIAVAMIWLLEPFGSAPQFGRVASGEADPETAAAPSTEAGRESAVMSLHEAPRTVAELRFNDGNGKSVTLTDFRGKIVLLNIWATWCGPCREEMPTLDRLQERLGGPEFEVVALSIDRAGIGVVSEFYAEISVQHLAKYIDESGKRSEEHTSELQSLMRNSYAVFCCKKKKTQYNNRH